MMTRIEMITRMCEIAAGLKELEGSGGSLGTELEEVIQSLLVEEQEEEMEECYRISNGGADVFKHYFPDFNPAPDKHLFLLNIDVNGTKIAYSFFKKRGRWYLFDHLANRIYTMLEWVAANERLSLSKARAWIRDLMGCNLATCRQ